MLMNMLKTCLATLLLLFIALPLSAQKVVKVHGEYTHHAEETESLAQAKRTALEAAKQAALAKEFGMTVIGTSTSVDSESGEVSSSFFSQHSESEVKGEWIETIGEPEYTIETSPAGMLTVHVKVSGKARAITSSKVELDVSLLKNGTDARFDCSVDNFKFKHGDEFFIRFKSPVDGFVAIYLSVEPTQEVFCLLPYPNSDCGAYEVEGDQTYVFFSPEKADRCKDEVERYTMTTDYEVETNELYVIFSENEFIKANSQSGTDVLPRHLSFKDFQKWFSRLRSHDKKSAVKRFRVKIHR